MPKETLIAAVVASACSPRPVQGFLNLAGCYVLFVGIIVAAVALFYAPEIAVSLLVLAILHVTYGSSVYSKSLNPQTGGDTIVGAVVCGLFLAALIAFFSPIPFAPCCAVLIVSLYLMMTAGEKVSVVKRREEYERDRSLADPEWREKEAAHKAMMKRARDRSIPVSELSPEEQEAREWVVRYEW